MVAPFEFKIRAEINQYLIVCMLLSDWLAVFTAT